MHVIDPLWDGFQHALGKQTTGNLHGAMPSHNTQMFPLSDTSVYNLRYMCRGLQATSVSNRIRFRSRSFSEALVQHQNKAQQFSHYVGTHGLSHCLNARRIRYTR